MADTWNDSFGNFSDPASPVGLFVSYATDPAYSVCNFGSTTYQALFSHVNGQVRSLTCC